MASTTLNVFNFVSFFGWRGPLSLHTDCDFVVYIQCILDKRSKYTVKVANVKVHATKQLIELLVWCEGDNLNTSWRPKDVFKMPQVFGTPWFLNCIGSSLLSQGQLWTTMEREVLLLSGGSQIKTSQYYTSEQRMANAAIHRSLPR